MTNYDVVVKLIGPIRSVGETHADEKRLENLKATCHLVESLLQDIRAASQAKDRVEYSMKEIGRYAHEFLVGAVEGLTE